MERKCISSQGSGLEQTPNFTVLAPLPICVNFHFQAFFELLARRNVRIIAKALLGWSENVFQVKGAVWSKHQTALTLPHSPKVSISIFKLFSNFWREGMCGSLLRHY